MTKTLDDDSSEKVSLINSTPGVQVSSKQTEPLLTPAEIAESRKLNIAVETALKDYAPPPDIDGGRRRGSRGSRSAKKRLTKRKRNKKSHRRRKSRRVN